MKKIAVSTMLAISLAGCAKGNPAICSSAADDPKDQLQACVYKWAYRLKSAPDASDVVAKAVVGACQEPVTMKAQALSQGKETSVFLAVDDVVRKQATELATFRVAQARAGDCRTP